MTLPLVGHLPPHDRATSCLPAWWGPGERLWGWCEGIMGMVSLGRCLQADYPFSPPALLMVTPNGRFETGVRLCLSMSDYHPELWVPAWSVSTILTGLLSFMLEDTLTTGSITTTVSNPL